MNTFTKKEKDFARELANYQDKWVAVLPNGDGDKIIASGNRMSDAKAAAEKMGFRNAVYQKVPSSSKIFIA